MITSLRLTNFRSHGETTTHFKAITLLIGPAGGGKSNLIKALVFLQNSIFHSLDELFPPGASEFDWVRSRWAKETDPIGIEVEMDAVPGFPAERARYTVEFLDTPLGLCIQREMLARCSNGQPWQWVFHRRSQKLHLGEFGEVRPDSPTVLCLINRDPLRNNAAPGVRFAQAVSGALSHVGFYHLEANELKSPGAGQSAEQIRYHGEGLPDFLAWAKSRSEGVQAYDTILQEMKELLPNLETINVTQVKPGEQGISFRFKGHRGFINAPDLSDGTVYTLGLLCAIHSPAKRNLLCIEEPETGLHPGRLHWLFDRLVTLAYPREGERQVQVVLTTHSPYMVDYFKDMKDAVQVVEQRGGRSSVRPIPDILAQLHIREPATSIGHEWAMGIFEGL